MTVDSSELELAERAARGDEAAIAELLNRSLPVVRGVARRLTGSEEEGDSLAQDAMLSSLESIRRYRGDSAFSTWVCGIVINRFAAMKRTAAREHRLLEGYRPQMARPDPESIAVSRATVQEIWLVVAELPATYREAIIARATSDTTEQAARKVGLTANAFRVRLHRARLALAAELRRRIPELVEVPKHAKE